VAKYRLIYEELLLFSLGLGLMKNLFSQTLSDFVLDPAPYEEELIDELPYELTQDQKDTIRDICRDMTSERRMNRLVQGDVGSGKTVVSAAAIYKVIRNGYQAALMAPTEILAQQHYETFKALFEGTGIRVRLLTSGLPAAKRREALEGLAEGETDLVIGTHAIFGKNVKYKNLALVVTDEQHRFGVSQREALSKKGKEPHILVMTATPIPRTLALVMYGDMDISIIRDKPAGRKEIRTRVCPAEKRKNAYDFLHKELEKGRQAYIVAPLIGSSDALQVRSAEEIYEETKKTLAPFRTELIHGRMSPAEKDRIMTAFKNGEISALVSTVVIEVGINVPNATVMLIENAERFGLAQMHQLRGRVGRGEEQSYCILVLEGDTEVAQQRAQVMEESGDGFVIAEKDLQLRGTGEFFGLRQHGVPEMRIADIYRHSKVLKRTAPEAEALLTEDPLLQLPKNEEIRDRIFEMYGDLDPGL
ncbi:MAG: ATP-dependent DNA helicase RecG, partial [Firmicutes bacterium]|nr:ATP-dependent DNA helicase RecG [Bacillota bacterium]